MSGSLERLYKGCTIIKNKHIKELQEANDDNKPSGGWTPVEGEAGSFWIPNKTHIKELRDAIEKGLGITESTTPTERTAIMEQYLNYDEEGTERQSPHQLDWNDPTLINEIWMGNISHMHIEDLRKELILNRIIFNYSAVPARSENIYEFKEKTNPFSLELTGNQTPQDLLHRFNIWNIYQGKYALTSSAIWVAYNQSDLGVLRYSRKTTTYCDLEVYIPFSYIDSTAPGTPIPVNWWWWTDYMYLFSTTTYIYLIVIGGLSEKYMGIAKIDFDCNLIQYKRYNIDDSYPDFRDNMISMDNQYFYFVTVKSDLNPVEYYITRYDILNFNYVDETLFLTDSEEEGIGNQNGYCFQVDENYFYWTIKRFIMEEGGVGWQEIVTLYKFNKITNTLINSIDIESVTDHDDISIDCITLGQSKNLLFVSINETKSLFPGTEYIIKPLYISKDTLTILGTFPLPTWDVGDPIKINFSSDYERIMRSKTI